jgi:hypothetical protein
MIHQDSTPDGKDAGIGLASVIIELVSPTVESEPAWQSISKKEFFGPIV